MNSTEQQEIKKEFLLERAILFSDAVFAIIITIMVIEIHLPEGMREASVHQLEEAFLELVPKLVAYIISFAFIAGFWMRHLKIFSFLKDYNSTLLIMNLLFLFFLSLFPATVSMISGAIHINTPQYNWAITGYLFIVIACMFMQALLVNYLVSKKQTLCFNNADMENILKYKVYKIQLYILPVLIIVIAALSYSNANYKFILFTVPVVGVLSAIARKTYYPNSNTPPQIIATVTENNDAQNL